MKQLLAILAVCVAVAAGLTAPQREKVQEKIHEYRIESQHLHIDKLIHEVEALEKEYHHLSPIPSKERIRELKARIRNQKGDGCDDGHVQCYGDVPECVSPLKVCDGYKDCKNGHDEHPLVCSDETYKVGTTISGITSWTDCVNHLPHMTVITITANFKPEAYPSQVYVRGVVSFEVDEHSHLVKSFPVKGYWSPGKRVLALVPDQTADHTEWAGHGIICHYNLGHNDKADCKIGMIASHQVCATFRGTRH